MDAPGLPSSQFAMDRKKELHPYILNKAIEGLRFKVEHVCADIGMTRFSPRCRLRVDHCAT